MSLPKRGGAAAWASIAATTPIVTGLPGANSRFTKPVFQTERCDVYEVTLHDRGWEFARTLYLAFRNDRDMSWSVCEIWMTGDVHEWIHVSELHRREGIATEVLKGLEKYRGRVSMIGATDAGEAFVEAYSKVSDYPKKRD